MTRKDFQWFAEWLGEYGRDLDQDAVSTLMSYFYNKNSRFDKWRFLDEVEKQSNIHVNDAGGWTP